MQGLFAAVPSKDPYRAMSLPAAPPKRPYVIMNMVSSVDGKTTVNGRLSAGDLGSSTDRHVMDCVRSHVDAVIWGAATMRQSPHPLVLPPDMESVRRERGLEPQPLPIIVTAAGMLPFQSAAFEGPRQPLVVCPRSIPEQQVEMGRDRAHFEYQGREEVCIPSMLRALKETYGITKLLLEGGPQLNYQFFQNQAVDEVFWTAAPKINGAAEDLSMVMGPAPLSPPPQLSLLSLFSQGSELFARYAVQYS